MRSPFRNCTFMSAVGNKFYNLNSIRRQDGWAGKCTTVADSKRMSQSWWWLCWTRGQMHCTVSPAGRKREVRFCGSVGRAWADGWHREGLLSTWELPHQTEENPLQSGKQVSGLCCNRGEENNWHLLEFSPHLLVKNAPEDLEGITPEPRKTIWPNLLPSNCQPLRLKVL